MQVSEEQKVEILLAALAACYVAIDKIRDRVENISLWIMGLQFAAAGWLLQSQQHFSCLEKGVLLVTLFLAISFIRYRYFENLEKGFIGQRKTAVRIAETLHLYEKGYYGHSESMYPQEWTDIDGPKKQGHYFKNSFILLWIGTAFLAVAIVFS